VTVLQGDAERRRAADQPMLEDRGPAQPGGRDNLDGEPSLGQPLSQPGSGEVLGFGEDQVQGRRR